MSRPLVVLFLVVAALWRLPYALISVALDHGAGPFSPPPVASSAAASLFVRARLGAVGTVLLAETLAASALLGFALILAGSWLTR